MFGIGGFELLIIVIILLVVVKPEDLPKLANTAGQIYYKWQRIYYGFINELNNLTDLDNEKK